MCKCKIVVPLVNAKLSSCTVCQYLYPDSVSLFSLILRMNSCFKAEALINTHGGVSYAVSPHVTICNYLVTEKCIEIIKLQFRSVHGPVVDGWIILPLSHTAPLHGPVVHNGQQLLFHCTLGSIPGWVNVGSTFHLLSHCLAALLHLISTEGVLNSNHFSTYIHGSQKLSIKKFN